MTHHDNSLVDSITPGHHSVVGNDGRQDLSSKIENALQPDSTKSTTTHAHDHIVGKADKLASHAHPDHQKSTGQKIIDTITPGNDSSVHHDHHTGDTGILGSHDHTTGTGILGGSHHHQHTLDAGTGTGILGTGSHVHGHGHGNAGRQDLFDKIENKLQPDSTKTTDEHLHDKLVGKTDKMASHAQPESTKTTAQKIKDAVTPGHDSAINPQHDNRTLVDKVKDTLHIGSHSTTH